MRESGASGKSSFARKHFLPTEILSSDFCRGLVTDDENEQGATNDAFEVLHFIARKRLAAGRLTVIDATNVQPEARKPLVALAREFHCLPVAVVLNLPEKLCHERNASRPDRSFGPHVVRGQVRTLRQSLRGLGREGSEVEESSVERVPLYNDRRGETGPFDIIGDVHGCCAEVRALLARLGSGETGHPEGRTVVFLGDLVDRGPDTPGGPPEPPEFVGKVTAVLDSLVSHHVFDGDRLVVAHAGMRADTRGRGSGRVRDFALHGETTGETDGYGLPVRFDRASEYRGAATGVYRHTPVAEPEWLNRPARLRGPVSRAGAAGPRGRRDHEGRAL